MGQTRQRKVALNFEEDSEQEQWEHLWLRELGYFLFGLFIFILVENVNFGTRYQHLCSLGAGPWQTSRC